MIRKLFLALCIAAIGIFGGAQVYGQDAAALAAALDKNKYKKKDKSKNGVSVSIETYVDIKNVPAVRPAAEYSGRYADEHGVNTLELRVGADGSAEGSGTETIDGTNGRDAKAEFALKNARVRDAVLTADKVFADGRTERLEAVFVTRTMLAGKNAETIESRDSKFGLGYIQKNAQWTSRIFLASK